MRTKILTLAVLLSGFLADAMAKPRAADPGRSSSMHVPAETTEASARADTLFLFAAEGPGAYGMPGTTERGYSFDGPYGEPQEAGWFGVDVNAQSGYWWHIASTVLCAGTNTDMSQALPFSYPTDPTNDYAYWCGRENPCGWENTRGYGNSWDQVLRISLPPSQSVELDFDYSADFEGTQWDYFQIFIVEEGTIEEIYLDNTEGPGGFIHLNLQYEGEDLGDLLFRFSTDGAWSDEDGLYLSNIGGIWIDNLTVFTDGELIHQSDFEDGLEPDWISTESFPTAGNFAQLYHGSDVLQADICYPNNTHFWAFFDPETLGPDYGGNPVIIYGPPYLNNAVESPPLTVDQYGASLDLTSEDRVMLQFDVHRDQPMDAMIMFYWDVAAWIEGEDCPGVFHNDNYVYYGDFHIWDTWTVDVTEALVESAGTTIDGVEKIIARVGCIDMCEYWCDSGLWEPHPPGPYFDNISVLVRGGSDIPIGDKRYYARKAFQDNFPEHSGPGAGFVRVDRAADLNGSSSSLSIGDSTVISFDMDASGGIEQEWCEPAAEMRPRVYMWYRISDGPHSGILDAESGDPFVDLQADGQSTDGQCHSPFVGIVEIDLGSGEYWMKAQADTARYLGDLDPYRPQTWAFDLNDSYFLPGDEITYFFEAVNVNGQQMTHPALAMSSDPSDRTCLQVRCLGGGSEILLVADDPNVEPYWREGFLYNGFVDYDLYVPSDTRTSSSSDYNCGLASRAELIDLLNYKVIVWDSGDLERFTLCDEDDETRDDLLLQDWLAQSMVDASLWVLGNHVANDLEMGDPFLIQVLGADLVSQHEYYSEITGVEVPTVVGTHDYLGFLGDDPEFWVNGGCPDLADFSLVRPVGPLTEILQEWEVQPGNNSVAGILNRDPDGNGLETNELGALTTAIFNPWSYAYVRDKGYGIPAGYDYARLFVGHVLQNIFQQVGQPPVSTPESSLATEMSGINPNPFNPKTTIAYSMAITSSLKVEIYDVTGRRMATLWDGPQQAGEHELEWNGCNDRGDRLASGVYLLSFVAGDVKEERKLVLLK